MALKPSDLASYVQHALGGTPSSQVASFTLSIINQAGRHFFSMPWKFRERPTTLLSTTASQSYVNLPDDLGEITYIHMQDGLSDSIRLTTMAKVVAHRNSSISGNSHYLASVAFPATYSASSASDPDELVPIRLELSPTPSAVEGITLAYKAAWVDLTTVDDEDPVRYVDVPPFAEAALIAFVRAFALGYEEGEMTTSIMEAQASPVLQQALAADGLIQPEYGPLSGGAVSGSGSGRLPFDTLPGPGYTPPDDC